eukprot:TRINITY_DN11127_c0_g1_i1.p4 TRINITY_DN11127_c0_g1~~TRINITY_DN11127_c0_g1_i1.p4  ORF type:complete len:116 (-),score=32.01 TRINITY_DN11127_c0_g1_i1:99-446(-)
MKNYFTLAKSKKLCENYIDFLHLLSKAIEENKIKIKEWEIKVQAQKLEYEKAYYFISQKKQTVINYLLMTNPEISQKQIDAIIQEKGLKGLSLQEKVEIANKQYTLYFPLSLIHI